MPVLIVIMMTLLSFQKETKGQNLLNNVCEELNLIETDYFGLRYVDIDKQRVRTASSN